MLEKKELLKKNVLFALRKQRKDRTKFDQAKNRCFFLSIFLGLAIITAIYFLSSASNVYRITVHGNRYLKDDDRITMRGLSTDNKFLLVFPHVYEKKITVDPLILSADITKKDGRLIDISVKEKKLIAYQKTVTGYDVLMEDGEELDIVSYPYLTDHVPYIEGFEEEALALIIRNLRDCDQGTIDEISEIRPFSELKYQNIELIMRDGNYIFTSVYGLPILNHYHDIKSSYVSDERICYYFEDISGNAYSSACPWETVEEDKTEDEDFESEEYEDYEESEEIDDDEDE